MSWYKLFISSEGLHFITNLLIFYNYTNKHLKRRTGQFSIISDLNWINGNLKTLLSDFRFTPKITRLRSHYGEYSMAYNVVSAKAPIKVQVLSFRKEGALPVDPPTPGTEKNK